MRLFKQFITMLFVSFFILTALMGYSSGGVPQISEEIKSQVITLIAEYPEVREAAISQQGETLSLVVIVNRTTSKWRAKEIGESFVRLVKTFSEDTAPSKKIGSGIYNYLIGVYYPGSVEVVMGAKVDIAEHITW